MKNFFEFDQDDKKLWIWLGGAALFYIIVFSIYWGGGLFKHIETAVFSLLVAFLPGYTILKLFLDKFSISDNRLADKAIVSFGLSISIMVLLYFPTNLRHGLNTDEKGWWSISDNLVLVLLLLLVMGAAFGVKYYQNKKKGLV